MGRAIVRQPQVFLMDEPLSNLDAKLRVQTRTQIASLQRRLGVTTVYVTHDQVEAMTMGDRVAVLKDGLLQQCASPRELFTSPANVFVAGFIGSPAMNLMAAVRVGDVARVGGLDLPLSPAQQAALTSERLTIGVRPESLAIVDDSAPGITALVDVVEELGSDSFLYCTAELDEHNAIVVRQEGLSDHQAGTTVRLAPVPGSVHLFDTDSGLRLPD
jgi:multiple sugar transport system ATP-binding protein